jgi:hypothetical protein
MPGRIDIEAKDDNVYLNVVFNNNKEIINLGAGTTVVDEIPVAAEYNVTKTIPIIDKASDFYASVIRFDIPLDKVPLFIMPIVPNQANPDLTPMIIGIRYLGVDYPIQLNYIADNTITAPVQNNPVRQVITPYYYVYTFENLIRTINTSLQAAMVASGAVPSVAGFYPYFFLDGATQLISLIVDQTFTTSGVNKPEIYMNDYLRNYLETFQLSFVGYNQPNGRDYVFTLDGPGIPSPSQFITYYNTTPAVPLVPPAYYKFTQEYPVTSYWISLRKIVVTSNTIPIRNEFIPGGNNSSTSGVASSLPILTDFVPAIEFAGQSRSISYYVPTSQYRLIDLLSDNPLYKVDIKLFWEDKEANLYPIYISRFQQASLKIGFFRKSLYKNTHNLLYK